MDAVTYPDEEVAGYIDDSFVALKMAYNTQPFADDFKVKWTPSIFVLDQSGNIHQSIVGFLPPEEFIPALELGLAKVDFDLDCLDECQHHLNRILGSYPRSASAPEAVYLLGVTRYKMTEQSGALKEAYYQLQERYPDSDWTRRASPFRLL